MGIAAGTVGDTSAPGPLGRIEGAFGMTHEAGQNATRYTDGLGVRLPADSSLAWRAHVSSFGEQVVVRIDVGFTFHPTGYTPRYTAPGPGMPAAGRPSTTPEARTIGLMGAAGKEPSRAENH